MNRKRAWGERLEALLTGALEVWRVDGRVVRNPARPLARSVVIGGTIFVTVERTLEGDESFWNVAPEEGSQSDIPSLPYAGIQGMLRAVREIVAPDRDTARLVIGQGGP